MHRMEDEQTETRYENFGQGSDIAIHQLAGWRHYLLECLDPMVCDHLNFLIGYSARCCDLSTSHVYDGCVKDKEERLFVCCLRDEANPGDEDRGTLKSSPLLLENNLLEP